MINFDFQSVLQLIKAFPNEQVCIEHLEALRWNGTIVSPFDANSKVYKCSGNKYKCKNTGKYFNVRTGTMFDNTKIELQKWFLAIYIETSHKKGIASTQLAKDIDVTQKTAWFMLMRIRACFGSDDLTPNMTDETQMDETFVGGKNKNRHAHKKVEGSQGRSTKDKTALLGLMSDGMVVTKVIDGTGADQIQPFVLLNVNKDTTIISDEWTGYNGLEKHYNHERIEHRSCEYVNDLGFSTNAVEGFWSFLKRSIIGIHHSVSRKHLQCYANTSAFRYNTRKLTEAGRFNLLLANNGNRLTYKNLING